MRSREARLAHASEASSWPRRRREGETSSLARILAGAKPRAVDLRVRIIDRFEIGGHALDVVLDPPMLDAAVVDERIAGSHVAVEGKAHAAAVRDPQAAELAHVRMVDVPVARLRPAGRLRSIGQRPSGRSMRD